MTDLSCRPNYDAAPYFPTHGIENLPFNMCTNSGCSSLLGATVPKLFLFVIYSLLQAINIHDEYIAVDDDVRVGARGLMGLQSPRRVADKRE